MQVSVDKIEIILVPSLISEVVQNPIYFTFSNPVSKSKLTMPCPSSERSERWRGDWLDFSSWSGSSGSEVKARRTTREVKKGPLQTRLRVQRVRQATSPHRRSRNLWSPVL